MNLSELLLNVNNKNYENFKTLRPINIFTPNGIDRRTVIHISGDADIGKTSLALECIYRNPEYIFVYIDTYFKIMDEKTTDNMYLFRTNNTDDIILYLNELNENCVDFIIIDSLSNLSFSEELGENMDNYITNRYVLFNNAMMKIINKCSDLKISLILLNTKNGEGKVYNFSKQLLYQISLNLFINNYHKEDNLYKMNVSCDKNKYKEYSTENEHNITLLGNGVD